MTNLIDLSIARSAANQEWRKGDNSLAYPFRCVLADAYNKQVRDATHSRGKVVQSDYGFGLAMNFDTTRKWAPMLDGQFLQTRSGAVRTFQTAQAAANALIKEYSR